MRIFSLTIILLLGIFAKSQSLPAVDWTKLYGGSLNEVSNYFIETSSGDYIIVGYSTSNDGDINTNKGEEDFLVVKVNSSGDLIWQKTFGGSQSDIAESILETSDNEYIIVGKTESNDYDVSTNKGNSDFWIIKLDINGNLIWEKTFGGSSEEYAYCITKDSNNYLISGYSTSNDGNVTENYGNEDIWIIKINDSGDLIWEKNYGGSGYEQARDIQVNSNNEILITGYSSSSDTDLTNNYGDMDVWFFKTDENGNLLWQNNFGGSDFDVSEEFVQMNDGSFIIVGGSYSNDGTVSENNGNMDYYIIKIDENGQLVWNKLFGGSSFEDGESISAISDTNIIVSGVTESNDGNISNHHGQMDAWIIEINENGNIVWDMSVGNTLNDIAKHHIISSENTLVLSGVTTSTFLDDIENNGQADIFLINFDSLNFSVTDDLLSNNLTFYPNPTKDKLIIKSNNIINAVQVFDINGGLIRKLNTESNKITLDIEDLPNGVYFIKVVIRNKSNIIKIIKE